MMDDYAKQYEEMLPALLRSRAEDFNDAMSINLLTHSAEYIERLRHDIERLTAANAELATELEAWKEYAEDYRNISVRALNYLRSTPYHQIKDVLFKLLEPAEEFDAAREAK